MAAVSYYPKLFTLDVCRVAATSLESQSKIFVKKKKAPPQKQLFADVLQKRCSFKNFAKFTGKHLCWNLLLIRLYVTLLKRDSNTGVLQIWRIF